MKKVSSKDERDDDREIDFSQGERGVFREWYQRAKGHFTEVSDEQDARRDVSKRRIAPAKLRRR